MAATLVQKALNEATISASELDQILKSSGSSQDPFAPQAPVSAPDALNAPRRRLAEAAARLLQLATDPKEYIDNMAMSFQNLVCLRWLINLNVIPRIPTTGSIAYAELADKAGVPENQLKAISRMAQAHGFLYEPEPDKVAHSRTSGLFVKDPSFMDWAQWFTNYSVPSAYKLPDATKEWGKTEKKDQTAFNMGMEVKVPFFDHLRENKDMNSKFSSYMRNVASTDAISFKHLMSGFDWKKLPAGATVVDVGGSTGHASIALAKEFPQLNFIVEDLPETIANSRKAFAENPAAQDQNIASRITFKEHDFFTPQPVTDGDVYLLRMIIHDWPDTEAKKILGHIQAGLKKPNARVVIMDTVLPAPGTIPVLQERQLRVRDLTMIEVFNAKERELGDWKTLTSQVGLEVKNAVQPDGSVMGVLEVGLKDAPVTNGTNGVATNGTSTYTNGVNGTHDTNGAESRKPVLIIGGGIGGLCLAQGLRKRNVPFEIYERDLSSDYRPQGYRLKLEDDAKAALQETLPADVFAQFEISCAVSTVGETDYDPISGMIKHSRAGGGLATSGLRASYTVDRGVFRSQLMNGIESHIHYGHELSHYDTDHSKSTVTATFKNGVTVTGAFLVGADGSRSAVRKMMLPKMRYVDTGAVCIYGKTVMTADLLARFPAKGLRWMTAATDTAPLIQSILIEQSPLTLLSEPIRFSSQSRAGLGHTLPEDYVYWVLIGRKEIFGPPEADIQLSGDKAADLALHLTREWDPSIRSLFELQDRTQASTFRVVSQTPNYEPWTPNPLVSLIGDAIHAMSPCGGVGANTALRDAAELGRAIAGFVGDAGNADAAGKLVGEYERGLKGRTVGSLMRSYAGSRKMFDQKPYAECQVLDW